MKLSSFAVLPGDYFGIHCASKSQEQHRQCCLRAGQVRLSFLLFCISKSRKEAGYIFWLFSGHALAPFSLVSYFQSQIGLDILQESLVRLCKSVASSRAREQRTHTVTCAFIMAGCDGNGYSTSILSSCLLCLFCTKMRLVPFRME